MEIKRSGNSIVIRGQSIADPNYARKQAAELTHLAGEIEAEKKRPEGTCPNCQRLASAITAVLNDEKSNQSLAAMKMLESRKQRGQVTSISWNNNHEEWEVSIVGGAGRIYREKTLPEAILTIEENA